MIRKYVKNNNIIVYWLIVVAFLIVLTIILGGATRLTDSGLSITEWKPLIGAIPPLRIEDWMIAFEKYKAIPEFQLKNSYFTLDAFKYIYWWEWGHRQAARLIAIVFLLPFVILLWLKKIPKTYILPLCGLFILGGLQAVMGWYMVQSGLVHRVDVSQYRLFVHLGLAFFLLLYVVWMILTLVRGKKMHWITSDWRVICAGFILVLAFLQSLMGAVVAGIDAGKIYTDWPFMDGALIPHGLWSMRPVFVNFFENHMTVQFDHRIGAYILLLTVFFNWFLQYKEKSVPSRIAFFLLWIVLFQLILGILSLILAVPPILGLLHQLGSLIVMVNALYYLHYLLFSDDI